MENGIVNIDYLWDPSRFDDKQIHEGTAGTKNAYDPESPQVRSSGGFQRSYEH